MSRPPPFRRLGPAEGWRWLGQAAELMARAPRSILLLAAAWLAISLISMVPLLGPISLIILTPLLTAGVISAFIAIGRGEHPPPATLFMAFHRPVLRRRLLQLGLLHLLAILIIAIVLATGLGNHLSPEMLEAAAQSPEAMAELLLELLPPLMSLAPIVLLLAALMMTMFYLAVPLLMFTSLPLPALLLHGLRAVLANWLAFLGLAAALLLTAAALTFLLALASLIFAVSLGPFAHIPVQLLFITAAMGMQLLMAGIKWIAFMALFGPSEEDPGPDQLLA